ncbi:hypothetical protein HHK36_001302 [Tetracentron sinense]|uniref:Uncharacterized protein n=1 Tax=Tetracentron sinense TaxID=13715 RepID=A0A835DR20_TETSI|nr:hypothetical protein HHK36_001302 [Tetracentron sinense]
MDACWTRSYSPRDFFRGVKAFNLKFSRSVSPYFMRIHTAQKKGGTSLTAYCCNVGKTATPKKEIYIYIYMALNLGSPCLSRFSHPSTHLSKFSAIPSNNNNNNALLILLLSREISGFKNLCFSITPSLFHSNDFKTKASLSDSGNGKAEKSVPGLLGDELLNQVSVAKDANEALEVIAEKSQRNGGVVGFEDCCSIITAALDRNNADLALSVLSAMRSSFDRGVNEKGTSVERWKWSRPDVNTYKSLVRGLAASLRVSDALRMITDVSRVRVSPGEEVPFGKIVRCPSCMIAIAVAQPQHGIQIVTCSKCRYRYELVSGDIISIDSEEISNCATVLGSWALKQMDPWAEIGSARGSDASGSPPAERSMDIPAWKRGLRFLQVMKQSIPAAVHSIVIQTPTGTARTHRFATKTVDLPAQEGERVTISSAAPSNVYREVGPFRFNPKAPGFYPGEPMCLTNHTDGRESQLLRAPIKNGNSSLLNSPLLFPLLALLATGDVATGVIDPSLPQIISVAAVASLALGTTVNFLVLPQLNRLPQRLVDAVAIKQQLLSQYDMLESRIRELREAAEKEVWMLARMCQLENKILAVGEPSYR